MKIFTVLLFMVLGLIRGFSQPIIELLPSDTIHLPIGPNDRGANFLANIINRTNQRQFYTWKYDVICSPEGWLFSLEDGLIGSPPGADTSGILPPVFINPNAQLALRVKAYTSEHPGGAQVNVKLYLTQFPDSVAVKGVYIFNDGCGTTNVNSLSVEDQVKVYPNPTFGNISVEIPDYLKIQGAQLYNLSGSCQRSYDLSGLSKYEIELEKNTPGIYILELELTTGERIRKKVFLKSY